MSVAMSMCQMHGSSIGPTHIDSDHSFIDVSNWMSQLEIHAISDKPDVILCGNKCDLEDDRAVGKKVGRLIICDMSSLIASYSYKKCNLK